MPRNASGVYTLPQAAFVAGTPILSASVNSDFSDIATALTQSLATTGVSSMTGPIKLSTGSLAAPSLTFASDQDSGIRLIGVSNFALVIANVDVVNIDANGIQDAAGNSYDAFPAGTSMLFFQTTAPTGWTKDVSLDNAAIRLVSGAVGPDAGTDNFTTVFAARTILQANLPNVSFNVTDPGHVHNIRATNTAPNGSGEDVLSAGGSSTAGIIVTATTGISVQSGGSGTAISFAVKYADAIRASKN